MPIKFTTRGYIELYRGTELVSRHVVETEAVERAISDSEATGEILYTLKYPDKEVDLSRLTRVIRDVDVTRPTAPANLAADPISETRIDLTWDAATDPQGATNEANTGVVGYKLYRDGVEIADQAGTSFSDTGRTAYTTYSYQVSAYDAAGNESVKSAAVQAQTLDTTAPTAPVITASQVSSSAISVALTTASTDSGSGVSTYQLEYKRSVDLTWTVHSSVLTAGAFPVQIGSLTASTTYDTRCRATDVSGNTGSYSATSQAATSSQGTLPLGALTNEAETPEQISLVLPVTSTLTTDATATCRYRVSPEGDWVTGHPLHRVRPDFVEPGGVTPDDVFAWPIIDLEPGTDYDVEVTVSDGVSQEVITETFSTRALPAGSGATTVSVAAGSSLATIASAINNAAAGAVVELADDTYTLSGVLQISNTNGTEANPIYVRGASRDGTILSRSSGMVIQILGAANIVFERFTIQGSGVDSGTAASSIGVSFWDGVAQQSNITFRDMAFTGVDRGIVANGGVTGALVYNCVLTGNNAWDQDLFTGFPETGAGADGTPDVRSNTFWNDDGIALPGTGNVGFNNTLRGFGDSFSVSAGGSPPSTSAIYFYRNDIPLGGDDGFEADEGTRNLGFYDNRIYNASNLVSLDQVWGGPLLIARNIMVNPMRALLKLNSRNTGWFAYNNTIIKTDGFDAGETGGWYQPNNGAQRSIGWRNNIFIYRGTGSTGTGDTIYWFDNNTWDPIDWDHNAHYPDIDIQWLGGTYANLAAAQSGLPASTPLYSGETQRMANDVITTSNPFNETITLGANALTEVTDVVTPTLAAGSAPKNSGAVIPNITDGYTGAAPDMGAVISGRRLVTYGAGAPLWAQDLELNTWTALATDNTFADVMLSAAVYRAWNGAAFVPDSGAYGKVAFWGGGHDDYWGNEVYTFDLETLRFARVNDPYPADHNVADAEPAGLWPDSTPAVPHLYYWMHGRGSKLWIFSRQIDNVGPEYIARPSSFDFSTETWWNSDQTAPTEIFPFGPIHNHGVTLDTSRDVFWATLTDPLGWTSYDPNADSWQSYPEPTGNYGAPRNAPVYVPTKDAVLQFSGGIVIGLDPANPASDKTELTTSGTAPTLAAEGNMAHWSSNLGVVVVYPSGSDSIYLLTPPVGDWKSGTWVWSQFALTGSSGDHDGAGTYGKFLVLEWPGSPITVAAVFDDVDAAPRAVRLQ